MKTLLRFILNLTVTVVIMIPLIFFFKRIEEQGVLDWLEVMIILGAMSIILILISKLLGRNKGKSRIKEIASTITVITCTSTILYCGFAFLECLVEWRNENPFVYAWDERLALCLSLVIFNFLNERCKLYGKVKNRNELVVVAEYITQSEAETKQAVLKAHGIESIPVMKENPMYIKSESNAPIQLQVMSKDAEKAKELIG